MNYSKIYSDLISSRKAMFNERMKLKKSGVYFEYHHIKTVKRGGSNDRSNLVLLTGREHYFAHHLLYMSTIQQESNWKDNISTFNKMRTRSKRSSREFERIRIEAAAKNSESKTGQTHSEYTKKKIAEGQIGRKHELTECPHCGTVCSVPMAARWHFDNCPEK